MLISLTVGQDQKGLDHTENMNTRGKAHGNVLKHGSTTKMFVVLRFYQQEQSSMTNNYSNMDKGGLQSQRQQTAMTGRHSSAKLWSLKADQG